MNTIWVVGGGPSTEFNISLKSAICVANNIAIDNVQIRPVMITKDRRWLLSRRYISNRTPERDWLKYFFVESEKPRTPYNNLNLSQMLLNLVDDETSCVCLLPLHGQFGEDGCVQGLFETAGVAYTGSGLSASALAFHKGNAKSVLKAAGIALPTHVALNRHTSALSNLPAFPVIVKPTCGGSSVGVTLVKSQEELAPAIKLALSVDSEAMIEQFVTGPEVSCSVLDILSEGAIKTVALPPTLIKPATGTFFDYKAKYEVGAAIEQTPAPLPQEIIDAIKATAIESHRALGCEGVSRTDMIVTKEQPTRPLVLEVNTLPGMTETSLLPQQAAATGIKIPTLIHQTIQYAMWRHKEKVRRHNLS